MKIKFSHKYKKLILTNGKICQSAKLLDVINIDIENLSKCFIDYDTDSGSYKLPGSGKYMILIFQKDECNIFTTIRRWTEDKDKYYIDAIGKIFDIIIEG